MNYLELCKEVRQEAGISGNGPASVLNQVGEMKRIVDWVKKSYREIQIMRPNWNWMRDDFSFNTTADDHDYTPQEAGIAERFHQWDVDTIKSFRTSIGVSNEFELGELLYRQYRKIYLTGYQSAGTPIVFSVAPDKKLLLGPKPDGVFTVNGQYWKTPQTLVDDDDIPEMPEQFHEFIVWQALEHYALYESAGEVLVRAQKNIRFYKNRLENSELPDVQMAEPLVD
jgi:hypothetical protein